LSGSSQRTVQLDPGTTTPAPATTTTTTPQSTTTSQSATFQQSYNTDRYEGPGSAGRLEGFDNTKLNNPEHNTPKYIVGRILSHYPNTPEGLQQALPEIQRHFPGTRIVGSKGDKLDFGSNVDPKSGQPLGVIDVIRAAGNGGEAWQWLPVEGPGAQQPAQLGAMPLLFFGGAGLGPSGLTLTDPRAEEERARREADERNWRDQISRGRIGTVMGPNSRG
jgi:hypothetical protein